MTITTAGKVIVSSFLNSVRAALLGEKLYQTKKKTLVSVL